jgi:hypothetical protein
VSFPVFRLTNRQPLFDSGVAYYFNQYLDQDTAEISGHIKIIDDKNIDKPTLSQRRLHLTQQSAPLYPLRTAIYFLGDFIKLAKSGYWFVDSLGKIFTYKKSCRARLKFRPIKQVIPGRTTGSILEVEGYSERFKTLYIVPSTCRYAGILEYGGISIFYGAYETKPEDTWRMI